MADKVTCGACHATCGDVCVGKLRTECKPDNCPDNREYITEGENEGKCVPAPGFFENDKTNPDPCAPFCATCE